MKKKEAISKLYNNNLIILIKYIMNEVNNIMNLWNSKLLLKITDLF
jgi:hypothetical protein